MSQPNISSDQPPVIAIDYASPATRERFTFRSFISAVLIALLAAAYAVACWPAYWQSSWPPLDRLSQGWSWVWVPAAAIYLLLVPRSLLTVLWLLILAVMTSSIHAWTYTFSTMNPVFRWEWQIWIPNFIIALPIHLITTFTVGGLCWGLAAMFDIQPLFYGDHRSLRSRLAPIVLVIACLCAAPAIAFGYAHINNQRDAADGAAWADRDWASHAPVIWTRNVPISRPCGDSFISDWMDPELNIPLQQEWYHRSEPGYNAEIHRLLAQGRPAWLAKFPRIADQDMVHMLHSSDMVAIKSYPYTLSANAVVIRGAANLPWISINTGPNTALVETRHDSNALGDGLDANQPILVGQLPQYPGVHFIRDGKTVIACNDDGWIMKTLTVP